MSRELDVLLTGSECELFATDIRLEIAAGGLFTYPDVMVVCGAIQVRDSQRDAVLNPTLIIEVLSSSTEGYDRGRKFDHYRALPSIQEYVLVNKERMQVEQRIRLGQDQEWLSRFHGEHAAEIKLESIGVELQIKTLYRGVTFESPEVSLDS